MAARKKKKENRIKDEKKRLKEIFEELEENKRNLVTPLIEKAAFARKLISKSQTAD